MHVLYKARKIRELVRSRDPVAAFQVILCARALDLPAVVQYHGTKAHFGGKLQLFGQRGLRGRLVIAVPCGIQRREGILRHGDRAFGAFGPPPPYVPQRVVQRLRRFIDT